MKWLDERVEAWHNGDASDLTPLHKAVGMSPELYARCAAKPPKFILGLDEVGYGALAGPLVVGGVLARADWEHPAMKDSKAFSGNSKEAARGLACAKLAEVPELYCFTHAVSSEEIDRMGVLRARNWAFTQICEHVIKFYEKQCESIMIVLDGDDPIEGVLHVLLPKADTFVPQVMAASILAKVQRDTEMIVLGRDYPVYDFARNKGYGSPSHRAALIEHGLCPIHRKSYKLTFLQGSVTTSLP